MSRHVLILGGHGNISQALTPLLLQRSWTVTSLIRKQEQVAAIEKLGSGLPGKLNVLVRSIEDVTSEDHAVSILKEVNPDYVAWSAGKHGLELFTDLIFEALTGRHRCWWQGWT